MEEKNKLLEDNEILENRNQMLNFENEKLKQEIKTYNGYLDSINLQNSFSSNMTFNNAKQLKLRIDELEDLIAQFQNTNSPNKQVELEELIISLKEKLIEKEKMINILNSKLKESIKKSGHSFDERQAIASLSLVIKERDTIILNLKNELFPMLLHNLLLNRLEI